MRKALILPLILSLASTARAELLPDEVAIVAMAQSEQSRQLAEYYAAARGVPKSQILLLDGKPSETISRETWERDVRPAIFGWLMSNGLRNKVRCLVTTWDVPLKIDRRAEDSAVVVERRELFAWAQAACRRAAHRSVADARHPDTRRRVLAGARVALRRLGGRLDGATRRGGQDRAGACASPSRAPRRRSEPMPRWNGRSWRRAVWVRWLNAVLRNTGAANLSPKDCAAGRTHQRAARRLGNVAIQALDAMPDSLPATPRSLPCCKRPAGSLGRSSGSTSSSSSCRRTRPTPASTASFR